MTVAPPAVRRLVAFTRDALRYAERPSEFGARRLLCAPYSGLGGADARALCVATGEGGSLVETIAGERVPLPHATSRAARRFVTALERIALAYRVQGLSARELLRTIVLAFALDADANQDELATLRAIEDATHLIDAAHADGSTWDASEFVAALEELARHAPAPRARPALQPLGPRLPEPPRDVRRRRSHFSASSLGTYAECARRWYFRYLCAAVEDKGSSASFYGTAFHWALERFHQEFPRADAAPLQVLELRLDAFVSTAFARYRSGFKTNVEFELQARRARRTARRYLAWFVERSRAHPFAVIGTETTVELELDGYQFVGYIDRLDRDDATGAITVVDYKTGTIAETAQEYRAKIARFLDFQLPFYYWARTAQGDRVSRLALVPLKDALRDVQPIELEVVPLGAGRMRSDAPTGVIGIDELERARARMAELARTLAEAPIEWFAPTDDPELCRYCAYFNACRERPLAREDRFGR